MLANDTKLEVQLSWLTGEWVHLLLVSGKRRVPIDAAYSVQQIGEFLRGLVALKDTLGKVETIVTDEQSKAWLISVRHVKDQFELTVKKTRFVSKIRFRAANGRMRHRAPWRETWPELIEAFARQIQQLAEKPYERHWHCPFRPEEWQPIKKDVQMLVAQLSGSTNGA